MMRFILKKYKNGREREIQWNLKPISDKPVMTGTSPEVITTNEEFRNHIGQYHYKIDLMDYKRIPGFTVRIKSTRYFRKTLKALKKAVNSEFKKYGHVSYYKVK